MILMDGKAAAAGIRQELATLVRMEVARGMRAPGLAVVLVGDDPASQIYVRNKQKACAEAGIHSEAHILPRGTGQKELLHLLDTLNARTDIDGILVQLPLPVGLDAAVCTGAIAPDKDVDGFHPVNMGKLALGLPCLKPCTPAGVLRLLSIYGFNPAGKKAVVVGRSNIVGMPLALLLAQKQFNATVTICHSGTADLKRECLAADYLFLAMGRPRAIGADMIHEGCIVVDIGINRTPGGLCGDADFEAMSRKAAAMTPVPGGAGPMTIAMLLENTVFSWRQRLGLVS